MRWLRMGYWLARLIGNMEIRHGLDKLIRVKRIRYWLVFGQAD